MIRTRALACLAIAAVLAACGSDDGEGATEEIDSRSASTATSTTVADGSDPSVCDDTVGRDDDTDDDEIDDDDQGRGRDDAPDCPSEGDESERTPEGAVSITSDQDHTCDGEDVEVSGMSLEVTLSGACGAVTVTGQRNTVEVDDASAVVVEGVGQEIEVSGTAGAISLEGVGHELDQDGDAPVEDNSASSSVG